MIMRFMLAMFATVSVLGWSMSDDMEITRFPAGPISVLAGETDPLAFTVDFVVHKQQDPANWDLTEMDWQWVIPAEGANPERTWDGSAWTTTDSWSPILGEASGFWSDVTATTGEIDASFDSDEFDATFFDGGASVSFLIRMRYDLTELVAEAESSDTMTIVAQKPAAPASVSPNGSVSASQPQISWSAVTGADAYRVRILDDSDTDLISAWETTAITGTSLTFPQTMTAGTRYRVFVNATNSGGLSTLARTTTVFYTPPAPADPVNGSLSPTGEVTANQPTFTWTAVSGATSYYLGLLSENEGWLEPAWRENPIATNSYQPSVALAANETYDIYLIAANANGESGSVSMGDATFKIRSQTTRSSGRPFILDFVMEDPICDDENFPDTVNWTFELTSDAPVSESTLEIALGASSTYVAYRDTWDLYWNGVAWVDEESQVSLTDAVTAGWIKYYTFTSELISSTYHHELQVLINNGVAMLGGPGAWKQNVYLGASAGAGPNSQGVWSQWRDFHRRSEAKVQVDLTDDREYVIGSVGTASFDLGIDTLCGANHRIALFDDRGASGRYYWTGQTWSLSDNDSTEWVDLAWAENQWQGMQVTASGSASDRSYTIVLTADFPWEAFFHDGVKPLAMQDIDISVRVDGGNGTFFSRPRQARFRNLTADFTAELAISELGTLPLATQLLPSGTRVVFDEGSSLLDSGDLTSSLTGLAPALSDLLEVAVALYKTEAGNPVPVGDPVTVPLTDLGALGSSSLLADLQTNLDNLIEHDIDNPQQDVYYLVAYLRPAGEDSIFPHGDFAFRIQSVPGNYAVTDLSPDTILAVGYRFVYRAPSSFPPWVNTDIQQDYGDTGSASPFDSVSTDADHTYVTNTGNRLRLNPSFGAYAHNWRLEGITPSTTSVLLEQGASEYFTFDFYDPTGTTYDSYLLTYTGSDAYGLTRQIELPLAEIRDFSYEHLVLEYAMTGHAASVAILPFESRSIPTVDLTCMRPSNENKVGLVNVLTHNRVENDDVTVLLRSRVRESAGGTESWNVNPRTIDFTDHPDDDYDPVFASGSLNFFFPFDGYDLLGCDSASPPSGQETVPFPLSIALETLTDDLTGRVYYYAGSTESPDYSSGQGASSHDATVDWNPNIDIVYDNCTYCEDSVDTDPQAITTVEPASFDWEYTTTGGYQLLDHEPIVFEPHFDQDLYDPNDGPWYMEIRFTLSDVPFVDASPDPIPNTITRFVNLNDSLDNLIGSGVPLVSGNRYEIDLNTFYEVATDCAPSCGTWWDDFTDTSVGFLDAFQNGSVISSANLATKELNYSIRIYQDGSVHTNPIKLVAYYSPLNAISFTDTTPSPVPVSDIALTGLAGSPLETFAGDTADHLVTTYYALNTGANDDPPTVFDPANLDWKWVYDDGTTTWYWSSSGWTTTDSWTDVLATSDNLFSDVVSLATTRQIEADLTSTEVADLLDGDQSREIEIQLRYNVGGINEVAPADVTLQILSLSDQGEDITVSFGTAFDESFSTSPSFPGDLTTQIPLAIDGPAISGRFTWSWEIDVSGTPHYWDGSAWSDQTDDQWQPFGEGFFESCYVSVTDGQIVVSIPHADLEALFDGTNTSRTISIGLRYDPTDGALSDIIAGGTTPVLTLELLEISDLTVATPNHLESGVGIDHPPLDLPSSLAPYVMTGEPFVLETSQTGAAELGFALTRNPLVLQVNEPPTDPLAGLTDTTNEIFTWLTYDVDPDHQHAEVYAWVVPFNPGYLGETTASAALRDYASRTAFTLDWTAATTWTTVENVAYKVVDEAGSLRLYLAIFVPDNAIDGSRPATTLDSEQRHLNAISRNSLLGSGDAKHNRMLTIHYLDSGVLEQPDGVSQKLFELSFVDQLGRGKAMRSIGQNAPRTDLVNQMHVAGITQFDPLGRPIRNAKPYLDTLGGNFGVLGNTTRESLFNEANAFWSDPNIDVDADDQDAWRTIQGEDMAESRIVYESDLGKERILAQTTFGETSNDADGLRYARFHYISIPAPTIDLDLYHMIPSENGAPALQGVIKVDPNGGITAQFTGADPEMPLISIKNPSVELLALWGLDVEDNATPTNWSEIDNTTLFLPENYTTLVAANGGTSQVLTTVYAYDELGRLSAVYPPRTVTTTIEYDDNEPPVASLVLDVEENALVEVNTYDQYDRITSTLSSDTGLVGSGDRAEQGKTIFIYDEDGLLRLSQNALQREHDWWTLQEYDALDRVLEVHEIETPSSFSPVTPFEDASLPGNTVYLRTTTTLYDRYPSEVDPSNASRSPFDDETDQLHRWPAVTELEQAYPFSNDPFVFSHPLGAVTQVVSEDSAHRSYVDHKGRVVCNVILIRGVSEPQIAWIEYNNKDLVTRQLHTNSGIAYGYTYDAWDRLVRVTDLDNLNARAIFHLTAASEIAGQGTTPVITPVALGPVLDEQADPDRLTDYLASGSDKTTLSEVSYSPTGLVTEIDFQDGLVRERFRYDIRDLLLTKEVRTETDQASSELYRQDLAHFDQNTALTGAAPTGHLPLFNGQITRMKERFTDGLGGIDSVSHHYRYDLAYQLTQAVTTWSSGTTTEHAYTYDKHGNRITETRDDPVVSGVPAAGSETLTHTLVADANQLASFGSASSGTTSLTYDELGNVVGITDSEKTVTLTYANASNATVGQSHILPIEITRTDAATSEVITHELAYDAAGTRIKKAVTDANGTETTYYLPVGTDNLAELSADGRITTAYIFSGGRRIGYKSKEVQALYVTDHLGSTRMTVATNRTPELPDGLRAPSGEPEAGAPELAVVTPVLHLTFDGHLDDVSGNGNTVTTYGDPSYQVSDMGQALAFDGNGDYLEIADSGWTDGLEDLTIALWVELSGSVNDNDRNDYLISNGAPSSDDGWALTLSNPSQTTDREPILFRTWDTTSGNIVSSSRDEDHFPDDGGFHHLVVTLESGVTRLYLDGRLVQRDTDQPVLVDPTLPLRIGVPADSTSNYFHGVIDDLMVYSQALDHVEITRAYRARTGTGDNALPAEIGAIARYDFEESLLDSGEGGYDLTTSGQADFSHGPLGIAYRADANGNHLDIGSVTELATALTEFSFSAWVQNLDDESPYHILIDTNSGSNGFRFGVRNDDQSADGRLYLWTWNNNVQGTFSTIDGVYPRDNQWHHVAVTVAGGEVRFYIDGSEVWFVDGYTGVGAATGSAAIGANRNGTNPWNGRFDAIRIYDRLLSPDEVLAAYEEIERPNRPAGAPRYSYTLDGHAHDSGTEAAHGSLIGSPATVTGIIGDGLAFDGDDAIDLGRLEALDDLDGLTLTAWLRVDADLTTTDTDYVIFDNLSGNSGLRVEVSASTGQGPGMLTAWIGDGTGLTSLATLSKRHYPNDGAWHHIALTLDNERAVLALDGILVAEEASSLPVMPTGDTYLARPVVDDGSDGDRLSGALDAFEIFDRAFSDTELIDAFRTSAPLVDDHAARVALWRFDGSYDDTHDPSQTETVTGTPTFAAGAIDRAVFFAADGSDVTLDNDVFDTSLTSFGMSLWVKNETPLAGNNALLYLMGNDSQNGGGIGLYLIDHADGARLVFKLESSGGGLNLVTPFGGFPSDDAWHHVAITSDGSEGGIYIDGELVDWAPTQTIDAATKPLRIGSNANGTQHTFTGGLDDLRLYDDAISYQEIQTRFLAGATTADERGGSAWSLDGDFTDGGEAGTDLVPTSAYRFVDGVIDRAISLDGIDDQLAAERPSLITASLETVTFSTWLRLNTSLSAAAETYTIATNRETDQAGFSLTLAASTEPAVAGRLTYTTRDGGTTADLTSAIANLPDDGDWHQVAVVQDATVARIYIDGQLAGKGDIAPAAPATTQALLLGADTDTMAAKLPADLDEIVFANRVTTAAEIGYDYWLNAPDSHRENRLAGTAGYWTFDDLAADLVKGKNIGDTGEVRTVAGSHGEAKLLESGASLNLGALTSSSSETTSLLYRTDQTSGTLSLLDQGGDGGIELTLDTATGQLTLITYQNPGSTSAQSDLGAVPADGAWHLLTVVRDGADARFYVDGQWSGEDTGLSAPAQTNGILEIAAGTEPLIVDQLEIQTRALGNWPVLDAYHAPERRSAFQRAITDEDNADLEAVNLPLLLVRADTDPYGLQRRETYNSLMTTPARIEPHLYTGQEKEDDLDLYYYGARYYFPEAGRFLQRDPANVYWNPYSYVGNDPITRNDPSGEIPALSALGSAGADVLIQIAFEFLFNPEVDSLRKAIKGINWWSVLISGAEGLVKPGGKLGQAAVGATANVLSEWASSKNYSLGQAVQDFGVGFITSLGVGEIGDLIQRYGRENIEKGLQKLGFKDEKIQSLLPKACFAAGTLVQTSEGMVPIEEIEIGDLVLSRSDETGEVTYKPVINTIVSYPEVILTLTYVIDSQQHVLITTPDHPFWVVETGSWEEAGDLEPGIHFLLDNPIPNTAELIETVSERGPPGHRYETFNLTVDDYHTYFVAPIGQPDIPSVWVHNSEGCNDAAKVASERGAKFEARAKEKFKKKIIRQNEVLTDKTGKVIGEIDFETEEAIVEVGISLGGKMDQLHKLAEIAKKRKKRLDVIYGPDTPKQRLKDFKESLRKKHGNRVRFIPLE